MQIAVLANEGLKKELEAKGFPRQATVCWMDSFEALVAADADVYIDMLFEHTVNRVERLAGLLPKPVIINSVIHALSAIGQPFIRINAWPGFISGKVTEAAIAYTGQEETATRIFSLLAWPFQLVPDQPGMVAPRIVAMIVNEAYFALDDQVSTPAEIDTAMKLGTHYPFGPFEWSRRIGLEKIYALLARLHATDARYQISDALVKACQEQIITGNGHR